MAFSMADSDRMTLLEFLEYLVRDAGVIKDQTIIDWVNMPDDQFRAKYSRKNNDQRYSTELAAYLGMLIGERRKKS